MCAKGKRSILLSDNLKIKLKNMTGCTQLCWCIFCFLLEAEVMNMLGKIKYKSRVFGLMLMSFLSLSAAWAPSRIRFS